MCLMNRCLLFRGNSRVYTVLRLATPSLAPRKPPLNLVLGGSGFHQQWASYKGSPMKYSNLENRQILSY